MHTEHLLAYLPDNQQLFWYGMMRVRSIRLHAPFGMCGQGIEEAIPKMPAPTERGIGPASWRNQRCMEYSRLAIRTARLNEAQPES
jgi:hypothetical protein